VSKIISEEKPTYSSRIKSFVCRQGRTSAGQIRAFEELWPQYGLSVSAGLIDATAVFGRNAPMILEIGFGNGKSLCSMAQAATDMNFIGIEVHRPGVGALLISSEQAQLTNLRIYHHDAIDVLQDCIPDHSLDRVQLYFPDPWPKKRHHKRRLVQSEFIELVKKKLKPNGIFHLATDWEPYAEHMLEILDGTKGLTNLAGTGQYSPRPTYRPLTKYEARGTKLGYCVHDLLYQLEG
jgi:tRNA (guanine-N7-)-methyltransferase